MDTVWSAKVAGIDLKSIRQNAVMAVLLTAASISLISVLLSHNAQLKWAAIAAGMTATFLAVYLQWFFRGLERERVLLSWRQWLQDQSCPTILLDQNGEYISADPSLAQRVTAYEWLHLQGLEFDSIEMLLKQLFYTQGPFNWKLNESQHFEINLIYDYHDRHSGYILTLKPSLISKAQIKNELLQELELEKSKYIQLQQEYCDRQEQKICDLIAIARTDRELKIKLETDLAKFCQLLMERLLYIEDRKIDLISSNNTQWHPLVHNLQKHINQLLQSVKNTQTQREHFKSLLTVTTSNDPKSEEANLKYIYVLAQSLHRNAEELAIQNASNKKIVEKLKHYFNNSASLWQNTQNYFTYGYESIQNIQTENLRIAQDLTLTLQQLYAQQVILEATQAREGSGRITELCKNSVEQCKQILETSEIIKNHLTLVNQNIKNQAESMQLQQDLHAEHTKFVALLKVQTEQIDARLSDIANIENKLNEKCIKAANIKNQKTGVTHTRQFENLLLTTKNPLQNPKIDKEAG